MFRLSGFWSSNRKRSQSANGKFDREKNAIKNEGDGEDQAGDAPENDAARKTHKSHSLVPRNTNSQEEQKENSMVSRSRSGSHPGIASSASPSTTRRLTASSTSSNQNIGVGERKPTGYSKLSASSLGLSTGGITTTTSITSTNEKAGRNSRLSEEIEEEIYPKPTASELRVAQYEKSLTKGHCPKRKNKVHTVEGIEKKVDEKTDSEKKETLAKRRSEKRER